MRRRGHGIHQAPQACLPSASASGKCSDPVSLYRVIPYLRGWTGRQLSDNGSALWRIPTKSPHDTVWQSIDIYGIIRRGKQFYVLLSIGILPATAAIPIPPGFFNRMVQTAAIVSAHHVSLPLFLSWITYRIHFDNPPISYSFRFFQ